ncbi:HDOD domain-containing protein [Alteromonas halophila]|uniref:HDIG domain protein n=1 Tax=Alteromonas halophila TaxID=516698 RepID=A0A918MZS3_9ALTE|nr:HDOD domain-containing protein [Alteromonas halophila]GGW93923.1 HDIG domain protein [Alteromonas halophila]
MSMDKFVNVAAKSFTLPDVCLRIRDVLDDPRSDANDIATFISVDPSLTAKVLKLANSALFRFPSQIDSIAKAVNVIGGEALYNLVVAETATSAFRQFNSALIDSDKHWQISVYRGLVARYLAKQAGIRGNERFFVIGILLDLSEPVVACHDPHAYAEYVSDDDALMPEEKQLKHFDFTFAACTGTILERWRLPLPLYYPVKHLYETGKAASDTDISVLECARRITLKEQKVTTLDVDIFPAQVARNLKIEGETLGSAVEFASKEAARLSALIH